MKRPLLILLIVAAAAAVFFYIRRDKPGSGTTSRTFEGSQPMAGAKYCQYGIVERKLNPGYEEGVGQPFNVADILCVRCCKSNNCPERMDIVSGDGSYTYNCQRTGSLTCADCTGAAGYYGCE